MTEESFKFGGINNLNDPSDLGAGECVDLLNVDLDSKGSAARRRGGRKVLSCVPSSLWSNGNETYFVEADLLKALDTTTFTSRTIAILSCSDLMAFIQLPTAVVYSNGVDKGIIEGGVATPLAGPAGQRLGLYKGCLLVADGSILRYSDPWMPEVYGEESLIPFPATITEVLAVDDGFYVSADKTYFFLGATLLQMQTTTVSPFPAVLGSGVLGTATQFSQNFQGAVAIWLSADGITLGGNGGQVINLSKDKYSPPQATPGRAGFGVLREHNGNTDYLVGVPGWITPRKAFQPRIINVD